MTVASVALGAAGAYRSSSERALVGGRGALINPARRGRQTPGESGYLRIAHLRASNPPRGDLGSRIG